MRIKFCSGENAALGKRVMRPVFCVIFFHLQFRCRVSMASENNKDALKLQELADISRAIDLLCLLNLNDLKSALRTLEGGALGVFLGDSTNKKAINIEKVASALPRHLLAHIVMGERNFLLARPGMAGNGWLAYIAKGLHLVNCLISLEHTYPRLAIVQRGLEQRSCILDLLLLAGAVWNTELAGASSFSHYLLCSEGIRLTSTALGTALQQDLDRGADSNKIAAAKPNDSTSSSIPPTPSTTITNNVNGSASKLNTASIPYHYEWYDALIIHPKLPTFISLPIDTISLLQNVTSKALQSSPDHVSKICRSFHTQLEAFYLMCCSEEFIGHLLVHPVFLKGGLLRVLQQALDIWKSSWIPSSKFALPASTTGLATANSFNQNDPIGSVVHQILRSSFTLTRYVLFEKETPCFLDAVAASGDAFQHMLGIISTVTQMSSIILDTTTCGPSALESFKLIEILSDDSNFKNEVISRATPLLLKLLSFPPLTIEALFSLPPTPSGTSPSTTQQLQRDFMIVVFRVVGNLHCFNESVCKAEDKGMFLRATVAEISAVSSHNNNSNNNNNNNNNNNTTPKQTVHPLHISTNLNFLLHKLGSERQVFHLNHEELELFTTFTQALKQTLSLPSTSTTSTTTTTTTSTSPSSSTSNDGAVSPMVNHKRKHMDTLQVQ